jgi:hypothetical protein
MSNTTTFSGRSGTSTGPVASATVTTCGAAASGAAGSAPPPHAVSVRAAAPATAARRTRERTMGKLLSNAQHK